MAEEKIDRFIARLSFLYAMCDNLRRRLLFGEGEGHKAEELEEEDEEGRRNSAVAGESCRGRGRGGLCFARGYT